jgi:hypothetical protein
MENNLDKHYAHRAVNTSIKTKNNIFLNWFVKLF